MLLDLAEQFGAASAGPRLLEREAERKQIQAELDYLEAHRERRRRDVVLAE